MRARSARTTRRSPRGGGRGERPGARSRRASRTARRRSQATDRGRARPRRGVIAARSSAGVDERARQALLRDARDARRSKPRSSARPAGARTRPSRSRPTTSGRWTRPTRAPRPRSRESPTDADGWNAMVVVALFGELRQKAIVKAIEEKQDWPKQWLTDVHAAYAVLARHPHGDDNHVAVHYDFLKWLGAAGQAARVLEDGLARFPDSDYLHDRLRNRILAGEGRRRARAGLRRAGCKRAGRAPDARVVRGLASIRAAEYPAPHAARRGGARRLRPRDRALREGDRRRRPRAAKRADTRDRARARGARARVAFERQDLERALDRAARVVRRASPRPRDARRPQHLAGRHGARAEGAARGAEAGRARARSSRPRSRSSIPSS